MRCSSDGPWSWPSTWLYCGFFFFFLFFVEPYRVWQNSWFTFLIVMCHVSFCFFSHKYTVDVYYIFLLLRTHIYSSLSLFFKVHSLSLSKRKRLPSSNHRDVDRNWTYLSKVGVLRWKRSWLLFLLLPYFVLLRLFFSHHEIITGLSIIIRSIVEQSDSFFITDYIL